MTATLPEIATDTRILAPTACPADDAKAPVLTLTVTDQAVVVIARRMHDTTCIDGADCDLRDFHAMDAYEADIRTMLTAMVTASAAGDSPDVSLCANTTDRRWFKGKWWCTKCNTAVRAAGGVGWVHMRK